MLQFDCVLRQTYDDNSIWQIELAATFRIIELSGYNSIWQIELAATFRLIELSGYNSICVLLKTHVFFAIAKSNCQIDLADWVANSICQIELAANSICQIELAANSICHDLANRFGRFPVPTQFTQFELAAKPP